MKADYPGNSELVVMAVNGFPDTHIIARTVLGNAIRIVLLDEFKGDLVSFSTGTHSIFFFTDQDRAVAAGQLLKCADRLGVKAFVEIGYFDQAEVFWRSLYSAGQDLNRIITPENLITARARMATMLRNTAEGLPPDTDLPGPNS